MRSKREFTPEERDALEKDASTSDALGQARRKAGDNGSAVTVRGDDRTLHDVLEANQTHVSYAEAALAAADGLHVAEGIGLVHVGGDGATAGLVAAAVVLPLGTLVMTQVAMADMEHTKDATRDAATRDVLHAGMLLSLELPSGYVAREIDKLGVSTTAHSPADELRVQLGYTPLGVTLQHHADQGVHAALDFAASGRSQSDFFAANPKLRERYDADAAFRAGFDAYVFACKESPADAEAIRRNLERNDARYQSAGVPVRG